MAIGLPGSKPVTFGGSPGGFFDDFSSFPEKKMVPWKMFFLSFRT